MKKFKLSDKTVERIAAAQTKMQEKITEDMIDRKLMSFLEKIEDKISKVGVHEGDGGQGGGEIVVTKELRLFKGIAGLALGDFGKLKEYNEQSLALRQKAGYNNEGVSAEGGYLVPDPEFEAEIEKIIPAYGAALANARVIQTDRTAIKTNKRGSNVTMFEVAEGGIKAASKLQITQIIQQMREFAGIAIATDLLTEDAAIDFWQEVTMGFAEEMARIYDTMVFIENGTIYKGLLRMAGTNVVSVGAAISSLTWDHLMDAEMKPPTNAATNAKFYMHRTVWNILRKVKDNNNRYQYFPTMGLQTPWGRPVVLVDVMPSSTDADSDGSTPFIVFGDLKYVRIYQKRGMQFMVADQATVTDAASQSQNLFTQDMKALRATFRATTINNKFPEAFTVLGTNNVS